MKIPLIIGPITAHKHHPGLMPIIQYFCRRNLTLRIFLLLVSFFPSSTHFNSGMTRIWLISTSERRGRGQNNWTEPKLAEKTSWIILITCSSTQLMIAFHYWPGKQFLIEFEDNSTDFAAGCARLSFTAIISAAKYYSLTIPRITKQPKANPLRASRKVSLFGIVGQQCRAGRKTVGAEKNWQRKKSWIIM